MDPKPYFPLRLVAAILTCGGLLLSGAHPARAQSTVDPVFGGASLGLAGSTVSAIVAQPDGKIVIGGSFPGGVLRLNTDGSVDTSFQARLHPGSDYSDIVTALALTSNGQIVTGGTATKLVGFDFVTSIYIARLNADGSLDVGRENPGVEDAGILFNQIHAVAVQPDGKILFGGDRFAAASGQIIFGGIARLNQDGSVDSDFHPEVLNGPGDESGLLIEAIIAAADGKILVSGFFEQVNGVSRPGIARLNADGSLDSTFSVGKKTTFYDVNACAVDKDGKILIVGDFYFADPTASTGIARLNADGTRDASFRAALDANSYLTSITPGPDGSIIVGGYFPTPGSDASLFSSPGVRRLTPTGSLDDAFQPVTVDDVGNIQSVTVLPDGRIVLGGYFTQVNGKAANDVARLQFADGSVDSSFLVDQASGPNGVVTQMVVQNDGKVVIAGGFTQVNGAAHLYLARLNPDASPDTGYHVSVGDYTEAMALQADGKLLLGGDFGQVNGVPAVGVVRLNVDGTLDDRFAVTADDQVQCLAVQPDGRIVVGGRFATVNGEPWGGLVRLNIDGTVDHTFEAELTDGEYTPTVSAVTVQPDGKLLISGGFEQINGEAHHEVARLNPDGSPDSGFTVANVLGVSGMTVQPDGKILLNGGFSSPDESVNYIVVRLNADGSMDDGFVPTVGNGSGRSYSVESLALQGDGTIILGGDFNQIDGVPCGNIARLNPDGSVDPFFAASSGTNQYVSVLATQAGGRVLLGGDFTNVDGALRNHIARLNLSAPPPFFAGQVPVGEGFYYLTLPSGDPFGYYNLAGDGYGFPYFFHADLGMECFFDAQDSHGGAYLYDFKSGSFFYTSPDFAWPYLYDFSLRSVLYYYPDPTRPGHYNTDGVRYFYNFATGQIITK